MSKHQLTKRQRAQYRHFWQKGQFHYVQMIVHFGMVFVAKAEWMWHNVDIRQRRTNAGDVTRWYG